MEGYHLARMRLIEKKKGGGGKKNYKGGKKRKRSFNNLQRNLKGGGTG